MRAFAFNLVAGVARIARIALDVFAALAFAAAVLRWWAWDTAADIAEGPIVLVAAVAARAVVHGSLRRPRVAAWVERHRTAAYRGRHRQPPA